MIPTHSHVELTTLLDAAKSATILVRSMTAEMDAEVAAVKARFGGKIKMRADESEAAIEAAQVYADKHRADLLKDGGKSCTLNGHTLGWRDTPAAIKCMKGTTEKKLLERLMRHTQLRRLFVRTKPTLNKEAMQERWKRFKTKLTKLGARLVTTENFFVELDVTPEPTAKN
jgi:phage host-nuclease inhibitor protein Gam